MSEPVGRAETSYEELTDACTDFEQLSAQSFVSRVVGGVDTEQDLAAFSHLFTTDADEPIEQSVLQTDDLASRRRVLPTTERRLRAQSLAQRSQTPETRRFFELLNGLTVIMDSQSVTDSVSNILPIVREYGHSAYDAAYLDVTVRHGAPLATLDSSLRKAGRKAGIKIFKGRFPQE